MEDEDVADTYSAKNEHYYAMEVPEELLKLWSAEELAWCREQYEGDDFTAVRQRFFELERMLEHEPTGPRRIAMVDERYALRRGEKLR